MKEKILKKLRAKIILKEPFFSSLLQKVSFSLTSENTVSYTDEYNVYFGQSFFTLPEEQQLGVALHELLHVAFLHVTRLKQQKLQQIPWNIATDLIINETLIRDGYKLPEGSVNRSWVYNRFDYEYNPKHSAEIIYNFIVKKFKQQRQQGGGQGDGQDNNQQKQQSNEQGDGQNNNQQNNSILSKKFQDLKPSKDKSYNQKHSEEIKSALAEGVVIAKMMGKQDSHLLEVIEKLLKPQVNWRQVLKTKLYTVMEKMFAVSRKFNKRKSYLFNYDVIYEKQKYAGARLIVVIDTSGSMSTKELQQILSEIKSLAETFKLLNIRVIQHSYSITYNEVVPIVQLTKFKMYGRGGTSYIPVLENLLKYPKSLVIWFTDGWGDQDYEEFKTLYKKQPHQFLWVITSSDKIEKVTQNIYGVRD